MTTPSFRFLLLVSLLAVAFLGSGCDSLLDVEPTQSISEDRALETPQNVEAALAGAYDELSGASLYGGVIFMGADLLADDGEVFWDGTFDAPAEFWNKNIFVTNGYVASQWTNAYDVINVANNVLSGADVFEDEALRNSVEGQARFLRGLMYFELVRLYAAPYSAVDPASSPAVPIVLEPTRGITEADDVERASIAAVYDQVLSDLTAARNLLGNETSSYFADTYTASAILSRVHLTRNAYGAAAQAANRVIASGNFTLAETFAEAFNNESSIDEYIFAMPITTQDGTNQLNLFYASGSTSDPNGGRGDINATEAHLALYEDGDARSDFFYVDEDENEVLRTTKWIGDESTGADLPVIRLAEMYLTRAEANLRADTETGASPAEDVNRIRNRAGLDALDESDVTLERILQERKLELMFEGHLLHDLQRTERPVSNIPYDADQLVYPVPQREMDANPNLTQNPGYGS